MNNQDGTLSVGDVYELLNSSGYPRAFVEKLLPDWWDNSLLKTNSGALKFALIIKQRLGLEVNFSKDGKLSLIDDPYRVRFKHRKNTHQDELTVVKNLGKAAASIARHTVHKYTPLPNDPFTLRKCILDTTNSASVTLESLLNICWSHGIPVLFLENLPRNTKRMTGMIVNHKGTPSILLGFRHNDKARQLFVLAHEIGHLALGHVDDETLLIDEDLDTEVESLNQGIELQLDNEEQTADNFALNLIRGDHELSFSHISLEQPTELAVFAMEEGGQNGIDPCHIIVSYAFETLDWPTAAKAMKFFENTDDAIGEIKRIFSENASLENLSDEAQAYLHMLQGL